MVQTLSIVDQRDGMNCLFRMMMADDLKAVLAIEQQTYSFPWTEGIFRDCLRVGYRCRVLEKEGVIEGYGISSIAAGEAHILNLCVRSESRQQGLGRRMLEYLIDEASHSQAETMFLEVRVSNVSATRLYESLGFNEIGRRESYYPAVNGKEDALIMARILT